jgi:hypothetical protein
MRECDLPLSVDGEFLVRIDWKGDELFCESMLVRASRIGLRIIRSGRPLGEFLAGRPGFRNSERNTANET